VPSQMARGVGTPGHLRVTRVGELRCFYGTPGCSVEARSSTPCEMAACQGIPIRTELAVADSRTSIPELGMAAAGFACVLVIVSVDSPSAALQRAGELFAASIPLTIAGVFVQARMKKSDPVWLQNALLTLRLVCILFGDIGCGIGIYWVFRDMSDSAGATFLGVALGCWLAVALLHGVLAAIRSGLKKQEISTVEKAS
jgi:hypothetical protein